MRKRRASPGPGSDTALDRSFSTSSSEVSCCLCSLGRTCAECLGREDLPGVEELQDLESGLIRYGGSAQRRSFAGTSKEAKKLKSTGASCPTDSGLLRTQESTSDDRKVRVGSQEDRFSGDSAKIATVSVAVYLVQRRLGGP
jgi:hypothetical protein